MAACLQGEGDHQALPQALQGAKLHRGSFKASFIFYNWQTDRLKVNSLKKLDFHIKSSFEKWLFPAFFFKYKHFKAFESLEKKTKVQLEDPVLTTLHTTLVKVLRTFYERCGLVKTYYD